MVRRMRGILVVAETDRMGNVTARPVSDRWARRFCARVLKNGGPSFARDGYAAFFQDGMGAEEFITETVPPRYQRDIRAGWPVRFLADPWEVGHWYGYDAHTVCEG